MNKEKQMILEMLKEGKIDVQQAHDLLEACDVKQNNENNIASKISQAVEKALKKTYDMINNIDVEEIVKNSSKRFKGPYVYDRKDTTLVDDTIKKIDIDLKNCHVEVEKSFEKSIRVEETVSFDKKENIQDVLNIDLNEDEMKIYLDDKFKDDVEVSLKLYLPSDKLKEYESLKVKGLNSSLAVKNVDFGEIFYNSVNSRTYLENTTSNFNMKSANGSVSLRSMLGDIDVEIENGKLSANALTSDKVNVRIINGKASFQEMNVEDMNVNISNGSFDVSKIRDTKNISANIDNGNININTNDFEKALKIIVETDHAEISEKYSTSVSDETGKVYYNDAEQTEATLRLETKTGSVTVK